MDLYQLSMSCRLIIHYKHDAYRLNCVVNKRCNIPHKLINTTRAGRLKMVILHGITPLNNLSNGSNLLTPIKGGRLLAIINKWLCNEIALLVDVMIIIVGNALYQMSLPYVGSVCYTNCISIKTGVFACCADY